MISLHEKALAMVLGAVVGMLPATVAATRLAGAEGQAQTAVGPGGTFKVAQVSEADLLMRLDRLDEQVRQLTGAVEQLQYRNQQLEQQLRRQETPEPRSGAGRPMGSTGPGGPGAMGSPAGPGGPGGMAAGERYPPPPPAAGNGEPYAPPGQRRSGVFDPSQNPYAPGAPRTLGALPPGGQGDPAMGAPGGRAAGAPLDLSTLSDAPGQAGPYQGGAALPPPSSRNPNGDERLVMAPSASPKDEYDLAYGYVLRKDYALAEENFRAFLKTYPTDRLAADAYYWLGEALFQRQRYRDAAESFLTVSTRYEGAAKAPEALVRLGQSLAALGEKDAACGTLGEIGRKYPRAGTTVKQMAEREQKRVGC